jgi:drug/metabolite transporter (DMT)-like permease
MGFIGFFFLIWTASVGEHPFGPDRVSRKWSIAAAACKGMGVLLFYISLTLIPVNRAVILSTVAPVVNLVLVHLLLESEKVRRHHVAGIALTFLGMISVLLLRKGAAHAGAGASFNSYLGDAAMLTSVLFHQAMIIFEKRALLAGTNPRQLVVSTNAVSVVVFAFMMAATGGGFADIPSGAASLAIYLYLISFVGVVLFYYRRWLVSIMDVSYLNSFSHAGKALSILFAAILLGERIPPASAAGFAGAPRRRLGRFGSLGARPSTLGRFGGSGAAPSTLGRFAVATGLAFFGSAPEPPTGSATGSSWATSTRGLSSGGGGGAGGIRTSTPSPGRSGHRISDATSPTRRAFPEAAR